MVPAETPSLGDSNREFRAVIRPNSIKISKSLVSVFSHAAFKIEISREVYEAGSKLSEEERAIVNADQPGSMTQIWLSTPFTSLSHLKLFLLKGNSLSFLLGTQNDAAPGFLHGLQHFLGMALMDLNYLDALHQRVCLEPELQKLGISRIITLLQARYLSTRALSNSDSTGVMYLPPEALKAPDSEIPWKEERARLLKDFDIIRTNTILKDSKLDQRISVHLTDSQFHALEHYVGLPGMRPEPPLPPDLDPQIKSRVGRGDALNYLLGALEPSPSPNSALDYCLFLHAALSYVPYLDWWHTTFEKKQQTKLLEIGIMTASQLIELLQCEYFLLREEAFGSGDRRLLLSPGLNPAFLDSLKTLEVFRKSSILKWIETDQDERILLLRLALDDPKIQASLGLNSSDGVQLWRDVIRDELKTLEDLKKARTLLEKMMRADFQSWCKKKLPKKSVKMVNKFIMSRFSVVMLLLRIELDDGTWRTEEVVERFHCFSNNDSKLVGAMASLPRARSDRWREAHLAAYDLKRYSRFIPEYLKVNHEIDSIYCSSECLGLSREPLVLCGFPDCTKKIHRTCMKKSRVDHLPLTQAEAQYHPAMDSAGLPSVFCEAHLHPESVFCQGAEARPSIVLDLSCLSHCQLHCSIGDLMRHGGLHPMDVRLRPCPACVREGCHRPYHAQCLQHGALLGGLKRDCSTGLCEKHVRQRHARDPKLGPCGLVALYGVEALDSKGMAQFDQTPYHLLPNAASNLQYKLLQPLLPAMERQVVRQNREGVIDRAAALQHHCLPSRPSLCQINHMLARPDLIADWMLSFARCSKCGDSSLEYHSLCLMQSVPGTGDLSLSDQFKSAPLLLCPHHAGLRALDSRSASKPSILDVTYPLLTSHPFREHFALESQVKSSGPTPSAPEPADPHGEESPSRGSGREDGEDDDDMSDQRTLTTLQRSQAGSDQDEEMNEDEEEEEDGEGDDEEEQKVEAPNPAEPLTLVIGADYHRDPTTADHSRLARLTGSVFTAGREPVSVCLPEHRQIQSDPHAQLLDGFPDISEQLRESIPGHRAFTRVIFDFLSPDYREFTPSAVARVIRSLTSNSLIDTETVIETPNFRLWSTGAFDPFSLNEARSDIESADTSMSEPIDHTARIFRFLLEPRSGSAYLDVPVSEPSFEIFERHLPDVHPRLPVLEIRYEKDSDGCMRRLVGLREAWNNLSAAAPTQGPATVRPNQPSILQPPQRSMSLAAAPAPAARPTRKHSTASSRSHRRSRSRRRSQDDGVTVAAGPGPGSPDAPNTESATTTISIGAQSSRSAANLGNAGAAAGTEASAQATNTSAAMEIEATETHTSSTMVANTAASTDSTAAAVMSSSVLGTTMVGAVSSDTSANAIDAMSAALQAGTNAESKEAGMQVDETKTTNNDAVTKTAIDETQAPAAADNPGGALAESAAVGKPDGTSGPQPNPEDTPKDAGGASEESKAPAAADDSSAKVSNTDDSALTTLFSAEDIQLAIADSLKSQEEWNQAQRRLRELRDSTEVASKGDSIHQSIHVTSSAKAIQEAKLDTADVDMDLAMAINLSKTEMEKLQKKYNRPDDWESSPSEVLFDEIWSATNFADDEILKIADVKDVKRPGLLKDGKIPGERNGTIFQAIALEEHDPMKDPFGDSPNIPLRFESISGDNLDCGPRSCAAAAFPELTHQGSRNKSGGQPQDRAAKAAEKSIAEGMRQVWGDLLETLKDPSAFSDPKYNHLIANLCRAWGAKCNAEQLQELVNLLGKSLPKSGKPVGAEMMALSSFLQNSHLRYWQNHPECAFSGLLIAGQGFTTMFPDPEAEKKGWRWERDVTEVNLRQGHMLFTGKELGHWSLLFHAVDLLLALNHPLLPEGFVPSILYPLTHHVNNRHFLMMHLIYRLKGVPFYIRPWDIVEYENKDGEVLLGVVAQIVMKLSPLSNEQLLSISQITRTILGTAATADERMKASEFQSNLSFHLAPTFRLIIMPLKYFKHAKDYDPAMANNGVSKPKDWRPEVTEEAAKEGYFVDSVPYTDITRVIEWGEKFKELWEPAKKKSKFTPPSSPCTLATNVDWPSFSTLYIVAELYQMVMREWHPHGTMTTGTIEIGFDRSEDIKKDFVDQIQSKYKDMESQIVSPASLKLWYKSVARCARESYPLTFVKDLIHFYRQWTLSKPYRLPDHERTLAEMMATGSSGYNSDTCGPELKGEECLRILRIYGNYAGIGDGANDSDKKFFDRTLRKDYVGWEPVMKQWTLAYLKDQRIPRRTEFCRQVIATNALKDLTIDPKTKKPKDAPVIIDWSALSPDEHIVGKKDLPGHKPQFEQFLKDAAIDLTVEPPQMPKRAATLLACINASPTIDSDEAAEAQRTARTAAKKSDEMKKKLPAKKLPSRKASRKSGPPSASDAEESDAEEAAKVKKPDTRKKKRTKEEEVLGGGGGDEEEVEEQADVGLAQQEEDEAEAAAEEKPEDYPQGPNGERFLKLTQLRKILQGLPKDLEGLQEVLDALEKHKSATPHLDVRDLIHRDDALHLNQLNVYEGLFKLLLTAFPLRLGHPPFLSKASLSTAATPKGHPLPVLNRLTSGTGSSKLDSFVAWHKAIKHDLILAAPEDHEKKTKQAQGQHVDKVFLALIRSHDPALYNLMDQRDETGKLRQGTTDLHAAEIISKHKGAWRASNEGKEFFKGFLAKHPESIGLTLDFFVAPPATCPLPRGFIHALLSRLWFRTGEKWQRYEQGAQHEALFQ
ncbi:MAG: hypothetical protein P4L67_02535, partial [Candidatus Pacebacteria bacterium]|nr:hypothetical protein [Candidatus Paceibacterota bacterium]